MSFEILKFPIFVGSIYLILFSIHTIGNSKEIKLSHKLMGEILMSAFMSFAYSTLAYLIFTIYKSNARDGQVFIQITNKTDILNLFTYLLCVGEAARNIANSIVTVAVVLLKGLWVIFVYRD